MIVSFQPLLDLQNLGDDYDHWFCSTIFNSCHSPSTISVEAALQHFLICLSIFVYLNSLINKYIYTLLSLIIFHIFKHQNQTRTLTTDSEAG